MNPSQELKSCISEVEVPAGLFIPFGAAVLIKECPQEEQQTQSGIYLPEGKANHAKLGIVYRVGTGVTIPIEIGMKVAFDKNSNFAIRHGAVNYLLVAEYNVAAAVPPENYLYPKHPGTKEKRTEMLMDGQKNRLKEDQKTIDKINDL